ncbi:conserved hypothetical protein [Pyrenophora tritici-repentis Pt-1C-BFP]|uniref:Uncharacterized protein n=1 Tax=Pyrenophora tritici-repentis (strain Pt-1C-BFP) TaxID=426418 RepID=B2W5N9_PYRTR|nr:uncharacterized protein PTRG_06047 [Pyrenophora tritici-repentis Pt-1C-BFP]EDU48967.1 conserved hypothetical protein [Pyrenophora tritici-repentis Pt-1C-BFP]
MPRLSILQALGALSLLSTTLAHMQMSNPSPLRDPHANRLNEPKDYNILNPLNADGSNFACKGYQWNTPWTPVATYEAVVNIVPRGTRTTSSKPSPSQHLTVRDTAKVNAVAQAALASYSDLFVANLAGINTCVAPETHDVVFGDPGRAVQFGDNVGAASKPTFQRNACTDKGHTSAGTSSDSASSPSPPSSSVSSTGGDDGQWHGGDSTQQQSSTASSSIVAANDGKYNPVMHASTTGQKTPSPSLALQQNNLQAVDVQQGNKQPNAQVQKELNAYLARLYGTKTPNKQRAACTMEADAKKDAAISAHTLPRTRRQKRWFSYQSINPEENDTQDTSSSTQATTESDTSTTTDENNSVAASSPQSIDASFAAFLQRLNSLSNSLFTLVKFTSSYLDQAPPGGYYDTSSTTTTTDANDSDRESSGAVFTTEKQYTKRSSPSIPSHGEMSDTPGPNNQALKHWLDELKAQVDAMKSYTQNTAARFDAKNVATLRQRRQSKPMGQQTEILFDWGSLYPGLKTNSSRIGAEAGGEGEDVKGQSGLAGVGGQQSANATTTTTTTMAAGDITVTHANKTTNTTNAPPTTVPKDTWTDGVFPFLLPPPSSSSSSSPGVDSDAAALFPFIMAPGPVLPAGVSVDGVDNLEHIPVVFDDLGDGEEAEDGVRKFFEGLRRESGGGGD